MTCRIQSGHAAELRTSDIEIRIAELERRLRHAHPTVIALFVKPQSPSGYRDAVARRHGKMNVQRLAETGTGSE
jgi:hypothetical protein